MMPEFWSMLPRKSPSISLFAGWLVCVTMVMPAMAGRLTGPEVARLVESAKILTSDYPVQASVHGAEASITTYRNPKATDTDCKIDSILIAKKIMDADPQGIESVRLLFYDTTNLRSYREVDIRVGDVKAFGAGVVNQKQLLSSIAIVRSTQPVPMSPGRSVTPPVETGAIAGIHQGERMQMLGRIEALRDRGVGVKPFLRLFEGIEDRVRFGDDAEVVSGINYLNQKLNEAEERYNQAHFHRSVGGGESPFAETSVVPAAPRNQEERLRQELGDLAPVNGPKLRRRYRIARRIADLREEGKIVDRFVRMYREIEELTAAGGGFTEQMRLNMRYLETQLGLPSFDN